MTKDSKLWYKSDQIINQDIGEDTVIWDFASELPHPLNDGGAKAMSRS